MGEITNRFLNWLLGPIGLSISESSVVGYVIAAFIQCILLLHVVAVGALVFIWLERKVAGRIQDRLGPTRVGGAFGWLQTLADGLKLIAKEDLVPKDADAMLFRVAPYISMGASLMAYIALPFSDGWVAQNVNSAVFFVIAVLGLEVFGVILAGYASGSKWSLFGAMRESAQVVSYEVPLGLCVVIPVFICGTMNLVTIGNMQAGLFTNWLIFHDPFTFLVFWVYFTCGVASVNRAPFDLAEAESELVAGFHTEYSGLRWSFFFMAEYGSMFTVAGLATILFFGGWNGPFPVVDMLVEQFGWTSSTNPILFFLANLAGCVNFILKTVVGVTVMMWVRWTLPRLRIDQVMTTCLKYCVPLGAICFLGALGWQISGLPSLGGSLGNALGMGVAFQSVRESWVLQDEAKRAAMSDPVPAQTARINDPAGTEPAWRDASRPVDSSLASARRAESHTNSTGQNSTGQDRTGQDSTGQDGADQDGAAHVKQAFSRGEAVR